MAKASRKRGKARWRSIDTSEVEAAAAEKSTAERQGKTVESLPNDSLFFIDKAKAQPEKPRSGKQRAKEKVLRSRALADASQVQPVVWAPVPKKRKSLGSDRAGEPATAAAQGAGGLVDLWGSEPAPTKDEDFEDEAQAIASGKRTPYGYVRPAKRRKAEPPRNIPLVEVDAPGCSYNPDREHHEDIVAAAVAEEIQKDINAGMRGKGPPKHVSWQPEVDPLLQLQEDAWEEDDDGDAEEDLKASGGHAPARQKGKKTAADRNRAARAKEQDAAVGVKQKLKQQRRDLQNMKLLEQELQDMEAEKTHRRQRRDAIKAEKALTEPPRLGKLKYEKAPVQVLLSSEITGSLRKLKAAPMLAKDRFKSLQKGGIIEPRLPAVQRRRRKGKTYVQGERGERIRESHDELMKARTGKKQV
ncbi:hypothetical protein CVIRNUC_005407 [Coccomyxa viridis]|uniref:Ribosome biogenesis protein NOP53 n=1 Tax=Coccomyxa viridis TaxID=1274662 RepID=A0AAV1I564_9CHLO|nr:hypothetical protein CVIRNUC_005407 [Coccomyxa viridis]